MLRKYGLLDQMLDRFNEFDEMQHLMGDIRPLPVETFLSSRMLPSSILKRDFLPAVECFARDKQLVLRAELPGIDPKDVDISIAGNQITLRGEKKDERKVEEKDMLFREISRGRFERSFALPEGIAVDQIKASFNNGVLEVTLPTEKLESARKVPIEISDGGKKTVKAA